MLAKGLMPFARRAASLALRCSINEFVSSIQRIQMEMKHDWGGKSKTEPLIL